MATNTYKELTSIAIEKTLMDIGLDAVEIVQNRLRDDYNCGFSGCLENPEYLQRILQDYYGDSYKEIIKSIEKYMDEFKTIALIENFLQILNK